MSARCTNVFPNDEWCGIAAQVLQHNQKKDGGRAGSGNYNRLTKNNDAALPLQQNKDAALCTRAVSSLHVVRHKVYFPHDVRLELKAAGGGFSPLRCSPVRSATERSAAVRPPAPRALLPPSSCSRGQTSLPTTEGTWAGCRSAGGHVTFRKPLSALYSPLACRGSPRRRPYCRRLRVASFYVILDTFALAERL